MKPRYLDPARRELLNAIEYYEQQNALGAQLLAEFDQIIALLRETPALGPRTDHGARRVLLRRFPYSVIYVVDEKELLIVAVAHQRRKPGYWVDRMP